MAWTHALSNETFGNVQDIAPTRATSPAAASHVVLVVPESPLPLSASCLSTDLTSRPTPAGQPRPAQPSAPRYPSWFPADQRFPRFVWADLQGRSVAMLGLRADGSAAWGYGACALLNIAPQAIAFDTAGHGLMASDIGNLESEEIGSVDRDLLMTVVDATSGPGASRQAWIPWTHEMTRAVCAGRDGFLIAGQASREPDCAARILEVDAVGTPPAGLAWTEPQLQWEAIATSPHATSDGNALRLAATQVTAITTSLVAVPFPPQVEIEFIGAPTRASVPAPTVAPTKPKPNPQRRALGR